MTGYNNEKNGLQQFQMESCQPIKRWKEKKKKEEEEEKKKKKKKIYTNRYLTP
jgi:hypothetical protein